MKTVINLNIEKLIDNLIINSNPSDFEQKLSGAAQEAILKSMNNVLSQIDHPSEGQNYIKDFEQILKNNPDSNLEMNPTIAKGLYAEIQRLQYHEDTTIGLWAVDRKPKKVSYNWIKKNCFRIKKIDNVL